MASVGGYDYERYEAHNTGPVTPISDKLFYRVDASWMNTGATMDYFFQRTKAVSTSWMYRFSDSTALTVEYEYMDRKSDNGASVLGKENTTVTLTDGSEKLANLILGPYEPLINFNIWGPYALTDRTINTVDALFEHRFNDVWSLRVHCEYWDRYMDDDRWTTPQYQIETGLFNAREPYLRTLSEDSLGLQTDLLAKFRLFGVENQILVTSDYSDSHTLDENYRYSTADKTALDYDTRYIDPENPLWVKTERDKFTVQKGDEFTHTTDYGTFVSERAGLFDGHLILLVGGRYDQVDVHYRDAIAGTILDKQATKFTYTMGTTWRILNDRLVAFCNSSSSFEGNPIIDGGTGEFLGFTQGRGVETGIKGLAFGGDLSYSVSLYTIRRQTADSNPDYEAGSGDPEYLGMNEERARGVELETYWKVIPSLTIYGSVGIADTEILSAPGESGYTDAQKLVYHSVIGDAITRAPDRTWSLATRYTFPIKGLSGGVSVSYTGERIIDNGYRLTVRARQVNDGYTLTNAYLAYSFGPAKCRQSIRVNLLNLFDQYYWTATGRLGKGLEGRVSYTIKF
jgi:iron complex outermembrane recepter protein